MSLGLNGWLKLLAAKPLPILSVTQAELNALMSQSQLAIVQYSAPLLNDPGFCVQLLKKANRERQTAGRSYLTTLSNAMSHLGQGQFQDQLSSAIHLDQLKLPEANQQGYLRYVAQACHGAYQAKDWAPQRQGQETEELQLAALLQNISELALWCYGGQLMSALEQKVYVEKMDYDEAAKDLLGCTTRQLSAALAETWYLPELPIQAANSNCQDFTIASGVALAARLARLSAYSWYDKAAHHCIEMIAKYKGKALGDLETRIHHNAVGLSELFNHLGYMSPARLLPMLVDEAYIDPVYIGESAPAAISRPDESNNIKSSKVKPSNVKPGKLKSIQSESNKTAAVKAVASQSMEPPAKSVKPAANGASAAFVQHLKTFQQMVDTKVHVQELIQQMVDTIQCLGFDRVVFAVKVPKHQILLGRFFAQSETAEAIEDFKISLEKRHLFSVLMEQSRHLWLHDENRVKYWNSLPADIKKMLGIEQFLAMSIFANKHSIGLMYADKTQGRISEDDNKKFQALCRKLSAGLVEMNKQD